MEILFNRIKKIAVLDYISGKYSLSEIVDKNDINEYIYFL